MTPKPILPADPERRKKVIKAVVALMHPAISPARRREILQERMQREQLKK